MIVSLKISVHASENLKRMMIQLFQNYDKLLLSKIVGQFKWFILQYTCNFSMDDTYDKTLLFCIISVG